MFHHSSENPSHRKLEKFRISHLLFLLVVYFHWVLERGFYLFRVRQHNEKRQFKIRKSKNAMNQILNSKQLSLKVQLDNNSSPGGQVINTWSWWTELRGQRCRVRDRTCDCDSRTSRAVRQSKQKEKSVYMDSGRDTGRTGSLEAGRIDSFQGGDAPAECTCLRVCRKGQKVACRLRLVLKEYPLMVKTLVPTDELFVWGGSTETNKFTARGAKRPVAPWWPLVYPCYLCKATHTSGNFHLTSSHI